MVTIDEKIGSGKYQIPLDLTWLGIAGLFALPLVPEAHFWIFSSDFLSFENK